MDYKIYQSRFSQLSSRFHLMVCLVFGLLISNVILSFFVFFVWRHHTIEVTPFAGSASYIKGEAFVDSHYLSLMAENFINERLNVSPETVEGNHKRLLSFIDHTQYHHFIKLFEEEAETIKSKKMSSSFDITGIQVNSNQLSAKVSGRLKRFVGMQNIDDLSKCYELQFHYRQGRLSIIQFISTKEQDNA